MNQNYLLSYITKQNKQQQQMKSKSPKVQLNIVVNPEIEKLSKSNKINVQVSNKGSSQITQSRLSPQNKRDELKRVQNQIQTMKNKVVLLQQQLKKQQQLIKSHKSRTQQVIKKKITVNHIQKYKQKDTSFDTQRAQNLRLRNQSLRKSHQQQMQNIMKAIYLVKLDDARQIKNLSKLHQQRINQSNQIIWSQQVQRKRKIAQGKLQAKQKYQKYYQQKIQNINQDQTKNKQEVERMVGQRNDQLRQLRELQIKLLNDMNKIQTKQLQSKKQYLAALSLPVKDVADALNRSKSGLQNSKKQSTNNKMNHMNSQLMHIRKSNSSLQNINNMQKLQYSNQSSLLNLPSPINRQQKIPNSKVNKQKLKLILKELKRINKIQKQQQI